MLARFLEPHDMGVYAAAAVIIELITVLTQTGVGPVLIQRSNSLVSHYQTAWTINIIRGTVIFCVLQLFGQFFVTVYSSDPDVKQVIQVLAFSALLGCSSSAYFINFQKRIDFRTIAIFNIACRLAGLIATIIAAYLLRSFWALVVGNFVTTTMNLLLSHVLAPGNHRLTLSKASDLIGSSRWVMLHEICAFTSLKIDTFLITRFLGTRTLGIYDVGYQVAMMPLQEIALPVSRALFPGLASLASDREAFRDLLTSFLAAIFYLTVPASIGLFLIAELLVSSLLPEEWFDTIDVIRVLVALALMRSLFSPTISALMGAGQLELNAKLSALGAILSISFLSFGVVVYGLIGMMVAAILVAALRSVIYLRILQKLDMFNLREYFMTIWRALIAALFMAFCVDQFIKFGSDSLSIHQFPMLLATISVGMISYTAVVNLLWVLAGKPGGVESSVDKWLRDQLKSLGKSKDSGLL